jgi:hypothetical protein
MRYLTELQRERIMAWLGTDYGDDGAEKADDAIVKLTDAAGRPIATLNAEWLKSLVTDDATTLGVTPVGRFMTDEEVHVANVLCVVRSVSPNSLHHYKIAGCSACRLLVMSIVDGVAVEIAGVHINTRDEHGVSQPLSQNARESIGEVVKALRAADAPERNA